ncbi:hypothetical protein BLOT_013767 [Blomia tropicalis]|nr:hypothetical protein BLOT_013767 [Blomia tropicalis]
MKKRNYDTVKFIVQSMKKFIKLLRYFIVLDFSCVSIDHDLFIHTVKSNGINHKSSTAFCIINSNKVVNIYVSTY